MPITKEQLQQLLQSPDPASARQLLNEITMEIDADQVPVDQKTEYQKMRVVLQFCSLPLLPLEDVSALLQKHVAFAIKHPDIDIVDLLTQFFSPYAGPGVDKYKQEVFQAIDDSNEKLGDVQITMKDGSKQSSTVGHWLELHVEHVGRGRKKKNDNLSYVAQEKNIAQLSGDDKRILRELFQLYNLLQPLPLDDARLLKLDDEDVWWGVDMPITYKGLLVTKDDKVINEEEYAKMQRTGEVPEALKAAKPGEGAAGKPISPSDIRSRAESVKTSADISAKAGMPPSASIRLDVKRALEKNSNVGDIVVSFAPFVNTEGQSIKPTVRAWLQDYASIAGLDYHTLQEREAYFFESSNAKALSGSEKANIKALLQSFDDGRPLSFTSDFQSIDFQESSRKRR